MVIECFLFRSYVDVVTSFSVFSFSFPKAKKRKEKEK